MRWCVGLCWSPHLIWLGRRPLCLRPLASSIDMPKRGCCGTKTRPAELSCWELLAEHLVGRTQNACPPPLLLLPGCLRKELQSCGGQVRLDHSLGVV